MYTLIPSNSFVILKSCAHDVAAGLTCRLITTNRRQKSDDRFPKYGNKNMSCMY